MEKTGQLVLSPPFSLDPKGSNEKQKSLFSIIFELVKSLRPGADLTQCQVPVILNFPKSHLQLITEPIYCCGQDLLTACAYGTSPLQRFLRVVAWHISTTRPIPKCQSPLNPILGEIHHVSSGSLNVLAEQVSHHPPITAIHATNEACSIRFSSWCKLVAQFSAGTGCEGKYLGERTLWLNSYNERYDMTMPVFTTWVLPVLGNDWIGAVTVKCRSSGLEAALNFKTKSYCGLKGKDGHIISGKIMDTNRGKTLYEISGHWNKAVMLKDMKTEETSVLLDAQAALTNLKGLSLAKEEGLDGMESVVVWRKAMEGIARQEWEVATKAKQEVEDAQRAMAKQRRRNGKAWIPRHFVEVEGASEDRWRWRHGAGVPVPPAPLVIPP